VLSLPASHSSRPVGRSAADNRLGLVLGPAVSLVLCIFYACIMPAFMPLDRPSIRPMLGLVLGLLQYLVLVPELGLEIDLV
jgi:hypothetical protein